MSKTKLLDTIAHEEADISDAKKISVGAIVRA